MKITINLINKNKKSGELEIIAGYDFTLVDIIKGFSIRNWDPIKKVWTLPINYFDSLMEALINENKYEIEVNGVMDFVESKDKSIEFDFKTKPYSHQIEALQYALKNKRFLLADEQGLGKTKQAIDIACFYKKNYASMVKKCLIICGVAGLKWNWRNEIETHSNEYGYILSSDNKTKLVELNNLHLVKNFFIITNIESLRHEGVCKKLIELCKNDYFGMVIVDEIHKCKNPSSQQGKALLKIDAQIKLAMTGTPVMNNPLDTYVIMKWLGYENHNFYSFKNHFCTMGGYGNYQIVGYKNMAELHSQLNCFMLRRLKADVLDLPEKIYSVDYVEMGKKQAKIYNEVKAEIIANIDKIKLSPNPLSMMIRLRQATAHSSILSTKIKESAKIERLTEILEDVTENEKVIIFSNWTEVTDITFNSVKKYNPALITGEVKDRQLQVEKFMNDESCRVIIGTIGAMGTGLTLTAASTVIFLDSPWNRATKDQAVDRAHRIGTKSNVNIITLVCKDTIDERIEELVYKKGVISDALIDGKIGDTSKIEMVNFLLS